MIILLLLGVAILQLFLSFVILYENRRSRQKQGQIYLAFFCLTVLLWNMANMVLVDDSAVSLNNIYLYNIANQFGFIFGSIGLLVVYLFTLKYPRNKKKTTTNRVVISLGLVFCACSALPFISGSYQSTSSGIKYIAGSFSISFLVYSFLLLVAAVDNVVSVLRLDRADARLVMQAKALLFGMVVMFVQGVFFIIVIPAIISARGYPVETANTSYLIGYMAPYWFIGAALYSIFKQQLFDIKAVVLNFVASAISLTLVASFFSVLGLYLASNIFDLKITTSQAFLLVLVTIITTLSFQLTKKYVEMATVRLFYQDKYDTRAVLNQFSGIVVKNLDLQLLMEKSLEAITRIFKSETTTAYIYENNDYQGKKIGLEKIGLEKLQFMRNLASKIGPDINVIASDGLENTSDWKVLKSVGVDVIVLLKSTNECIGLVFLGTKKGGGGYNKQDLAMLTIMGNELSVGLQNSIRFDEIRKFADTLQQKVDIATRDLNKANLALKALDETKDEFVSMASHQLRTPLTSMKGYVSMVLDGDAGKITAPQKKLLEQAFISSQRMVYLIADLLNVSRLKTGKFIIETSPTDLAKLTQEEIGQLSETAKGRKLTLTYDQPKNFPLLMLDETKTRQVLMNFIDNAIYYTLAGGHVHVHLEEKGQTVECRVEDNGLGVPKADQHLLFTKFYRAGNAKKARPDGTGLGLFMAKKVIAAQGGAIIFSSTEGKGSVFGFSFAKDKLKIPAPK